MRRKPFILVVSGPSGVGKSTVAERVLEALDRFDRSVSLTTRPPRRGDVEGEDYRFVSREEFEAKKEAGELLEWAEVHGNLYGTEASWVERRLERGRGVLLEIDVQGGRSVKSRIPDSVLVFVTPPSREELENRLRGRGTDEDAVIARRLENAGRELAAAADYDYIVVNDDLDGCVDDVLAAARAESLKASRTVIEDG